MGNLMQSLVATYTKPVSDPSRQGIMVMVTNNNGQKHNIIDCEQWTSIAWLKGIDMILISCPNMIAHATFDDLSHITSGEGLLVV